MNPKSNSKEKPTLVRQKSMVETLSRGRVPMSRSRTPPPRLNPGSSTATKDDNSAKQVSGKNVMSTTARNRPPLVTRSVEELNLMNAMKGSVKSNKDILSRDDVLALRYNAYLETYLMIAHSKNVMKRKENKITRQLEDLQTKLLDIDDKMSNLKINSEKLKLYKQMKEKLTKEMEDFENFNNSFDIDQTNEQIKTSENDLSILQLKSFYIPASTVAAGEIMQYFDNTNEDLKLLPDLERKIRPLTNLHFSLSKTRENILDEDLLKKDCERKLKDAEELLVHECYTKSTKEL